MAARRLISTCLASPLAASSLSLTTRSTLMVNTGRLLGSKAAFSTSPSTLLRFARQHQQIPSGFASFTKLTTTVGLVIQKRGFVEVAPGTPSSTDVQTILRKAESTSFRKALEKDAREKIDLAEYLKLAATFGFGEKEAKQLALAFTDAGVILHLPNATDPALSKLVHLKPQNVIHALYKAIDFNGSRIQSQLAELQTWKEQFERMKDLKDKLDDKAHRAANRLIYVGGAWLFLQAAVLARMTWWEFSWDIVEPITYFVTFTGALIGYLYFATTKSEYTYEDLRDRLARTRRERFYRRAHFDPVLYEQLAQKIHDREVELAPYLPSPPVTKQELLNK